MGSIPFKQEFENGFKGSFLEVAILKLSGMFCLVSSRAASRKPQIAYSKR